MPYFFISNLFFPPPPRPSYSPLTKGSIIPNNPRHPVLLHSANKLHPRLSIFCMLDKTMLSTPKFVLNSMKLPKLYAKISFLQCQLFLLFEVTVHVSKPYNNVGTSIVLQIYVRACLHILPTNVF